MDHLFGPVLSRRLGLSMGVDLLQHKTCNLDCVYCELGGTTHLTCSRQRFVSPEKVLKEIRSKLDCGFDHLTFAGSGEPTLSSDLGYIVREAKKIVEAPVAVITNSILLSSKEVRDEVAAADVVLPTLDAVTQKTFEAINRPAEGIRIQDVIEGLKAFRTRFSGEIWLEVMLVEGVNDQEASLIATAVESIDPDRIQLNTVVRPPSEPVSPLDEEKMLQMLDLFEGAEVIPDWNWKVPREVEESIIGLLSRRPCTLEEICKIRSLKREDGVKYAIILSGEGKIARRHHEGKVYFQAAKT